MAVIRDIVIAYYFGDSYQADAFLAAFVLVNMIYLIFTNGMKNIFIPGYMKAITDKKESDYTTSILYGTLIISSILVGILLIIYPSIISYIYPDRSDIMISIIRLLLFAIIGVAINSVLESYFEAKKSFIISALSQLMVLSIMILFTFLFQHQLNIFVLPYGYLLGVIISLLFKLIYSKSIIKKKLSLKTVKNFYFSYPPIALTVMVGQINLAVDQYFAFSFGEGVVTYLNYAKNLVHLPQSLIAAVVATLIFPSISEAYANKHYINFMKNIKQGQLMILILLIPSIVGMALLMPEVVAFLYQRGAFKIEATYATATVAYYYLGSVFFYSTNTLIANGLYTLNKGWYLMCLGLISICINVFLNYILVNQIGYIGIPLASSLVGGFYAYASYRMFVKDTKQIYTKGFNIVLLKIVLSTLIMAAVILSIYNLPLIIKIIVGVFVYFISIFFMKIKRR
nr:lipid II flippase MurJ [Amphibacillus cookii]